MLGHSHNRLSHARYVRPHASDLAEFPKGDAKFLPTNEMKLLARISCVARAVASEPELFAASREEADTLFAAATAFAGTLRASRNPGTRSERATAVKNEARDKARRLVTRIRERVRHLDEISIEARITLRLSKRTAKPKAAPVPKSPPKLRFVRARHESGSSPMHELEFREFHTFSTRRPHGATRLELFVDLIGPDEPIPNHPGANHGGRPWYLGSFTRNPIILAPPMPRVPMRLVYWGRWADSSCNVGPFSATAVGWIEGGSHRLLPGGLGMDQIGQPPKAMIEDASAAKSEQRGTTYVIAVIEAQQQSYNPHAAALPACAQPETRQLEGPAASEAA